ncbi:MAG: pilin [Bacillota bacterium]
MKKIFVPIFLALFLFLAGTNVQAQTSTDLIDTIAGPADAMRSTTGLAEFTIGSLIALIIKVALGLLGVIFIILIIFSGYRWMTASGNEEAVNKSKKTIQMAIIGLVIVLAAYSITYFVFERLPFGGIGASPSSGNLQGSGTD